MVFDSQSSHVKTHFSERLVVLLRQVRQVQAMGFNIFKDIATEVEVANKFYRCSRAGDLIFHVVLAAKSARHVGCKSMLLMCLCVERCMSAACSVSAVL